MDDEQGRTPPPEPVGPPPSPAPPPPAPPPPPARRRPDLGLEPEPTPEPRLLLPAITVVMLTLTAAVVVLMGMGQFSDILGPLLLTINLFIAAYPVQTALIRLGVPRLLAQIGLALTVFAILIAFFYALTWAFSALVSELPRYQTEFWSLYEDTVTWLAAFGVTEQQVLDQIRGMNPSSFASLLSSAVGSLTSIVSLVTVLVVMIFMVAFDTETFDDRARALDRLQPRIALSIADFIAGVRRYWVVSTIFGLIVALIDVIALEWLGVPLALVWGILAFLTNYIPNVGFVLGLLPPAVMALLANDPVTALLVVVIYSVVNFVVQAIIQPKFNGEAVGVTAVVSFLSLLLWSSVLGVLGALLALPMTLLAKALFIDHDPQMRWVNAFISNDPAMAHPDRTLTLPRLDQLLPRRVRPAPGAAPAAGTDAGARTDPGSGRIDP